MRSVPESEQRKLVVPFLALQKAKLWNPEEGVTITFVDRNRQDSGLISDIDDAIDQWKDLIDMRIRVFNSGSGDIRIGFQWGGHFSLVGTDSTIPEYLRDFNGQSLNIDSDDRPEAYLGVALHELGHALGAVHEHQSPKGDIPWDRNAVIDYYTGDPNFWTEDDIEFQIFRKYEEKQVNATDFDRNSIMLYPVPLSLLDTGEPGYEEYITGWNRELSSCDQAFMQRHYGVGVEGEKRCDLDEDEPGDADPDGDEVRPTTATVVRLRLDKSVQARLRDYGETHIYEIRVPDDGDYVVETIENPAIAMELAFSGSRSFTSSTNYSMNGRRSLNAKIVKDNLEAGERYFVRAQHCSRRGKGTYVIDFRKKRAGD